MIADKKRRPTTLGRHDDVSHSVWIERVALVLFGVLIIVMGWSRITSEDDALWHLATGRWIAENGKVPSTDVFSHVTPDQQWIPFEWGWDVLAYGTFSLGGYGLLNVLTIAIWLAIFGLLYHLMRLRGITPSIALITLLIVLTATLNRFTPRPHVITVLGLALTTYLYVSYRCNPSSSGWKVLLLPLIYLVWGNMHLGVVNGILLLILFLLVEVVLYRLAKGRRKKDEFPLEPLALPNVRKVGLVVLVCLFALLANPHGLSTYVYAFKHVRMESLNIVFEWYPPFGEHTVTTGFITSYKILLFVGLLCIPYAFRRRDFHTGSMYVGFGLISLRAVRFIADFAVVSSLSVAHGIQHGIAWMGPFATRLMRRNAAIIVILSVMTIAIIGLQGDDFYGRYLNTYRQFGSGIDSTMFSLSMIRFLDEHNIKGTPFHDMEIGGLLVWERPEEKNFIDSRNLSDNAIREFLSILLMQPGFEQKLDRYGIDYIVLHPLDLITYPEVMERTLISYCSTHRETWKLVYWDDMCMVYVKDLPKFRQVVSDCEYKVLHPYLALFKPEEFQSLRSSDPDRYAVEVDRKDREDDGGMILNEIKRSFN